MSKCINSAAYLIKTYYCKIFSIVGFLFAFPLSVYPNEWTLGPCYLQYLQPCSRDSAIQFFLFSSENPSSAPVLLDNVAPILPTSPNKTISKNFKMIVHGYGGNLDFNGSKMIRDAYLKKPNTEIIIVDWGKLSKLPCYPSAAFNTKQAGECTAQFLIGLEANNDGFKAENVHAIGFSLGAHVVSFASNALEKSIGIKFKRITGLDPALPFFATARQNWKLDMTDAIFVDVIHTNAGVYGKLESCGHVDFYMNNGQFQPSCAKTKNENLCSHMLAPEYFAESITSDMGFWGWRCESYFQYVFGWCEVGKKRKRKTDYEREREIMGERCPDTAEGIYFVSTHKKPPYAMG